MNLNRYIRIQLIVLSKKYDISLVEITKAIDGETSKRYTINYKLKNNGSPNKQEYFSNKRNLVSWLLCLK